ncbi:hypothetical protein B0J12DRAFT_704523 [Macrophomina phaseolina]|uniref:Uncharacterized protein n=1 Tax=Macrophomina phaseolina TaxID=35725 RepID=A0ABQ8FVC9_9PEZI|nr:hypothetical protein B0J12DRAFT_704523 [Macrophomina phaseolina]
MDSPVPLKSTNSPAESGAVCGAAVSKSSRMDSHATPEDSSKDGISRTGSANAGEHVPDRHYERGSAASHCETPPQTPPRIPLSETIDLTHEASFFDFADLLQDYPMDYFERITYRGNEIPRDAVVRDLFGLVARLVNRLAVLEPGFDFYPIPDPVFAPFPEHFSDVFPEYNLEDLNHEERSGVIRAEIGKPVVTGSDDSDANEQNLPLSRPGSVEPLPAIEAVYQDERERMFGEKAHGREHQPKTSGIALEIPRPQTGSTEVDLTTWELGTTDVPTSDLSDFWESHKLDIVIIRDGEVEFRGNQLPRVVDYFQILQRQHHLINKFYGSTHQAYPTNLPEKLQITHLPKSQRAEVEEETNANIEEVVPDASNSAESPIIRESLFRNRGGTPYPQHQYSDSDKENWSGPERSKKRRSETLDFEQDIKKRRRSMGSSPGDHIDLTGGC